MKCGRLFHVTSAVFQSPNLGQKWGASTTGLEKRKNYEQIQDLQTESALFLMSRCIKWNTQPGVSGNC